MNRFSSLRALSSVCAACWMSMPVAAQTTLLSIDGEPAKTIGFVAPCYDVDSDGRPDLMATASWGGGGWVALFSSADGTLLKDFHGEILCNTGQALGYSIDEIEDFDGDDVSDLLIGSPGYSDPADCVLWRGKVAVIAGGTWQVVFEGFGSGSNDDFGYRARGLGDVNADGLSDIGAASDENYLRIYLGPSGTLLRKHTGPGNWPSIDRVGDVDRDGADDYIIGWMQDSTTGTYAGKAIVYSGLTGTPIHTVYGVEGWEDENSFGDHLGRSVAGPGDVTGDGIPDFAVGAPGEFHYGWGLDRGFVRIYSGADASIVHHIPGETPISMFGYGVRGGGDINGDGVPDLLAGAPYDETTGFGQGSVAAYSGRTGVMLWKVYAKDSDVFLGDDKRFAIVGDIDLDGIDDWGYADPTFGPYGRLTVFAGAAGDAERICASTANSTGSSARLSTRGPISIGDESLDLAVTDGVPGEFGIFFYGASQIEIPFGNGYRCAGGQLFRFAPPVLMDGSRSASHTIDFGAPPVSSGSGQWLSGSTWIQQFWYRDPAAGGAFFNLSDALAITFLP